jgi:hypothetical protein
MHIADTPGEWVNDFFKSLIGIEMFSGQFPMPIRGTVATLYRTTYSVQYTLVIRFD